MKNKKILNSIIYIVLPIVLCFIYSKLYLWVNTDNVVNDKSIFLKIFMIVNIVCIILCIYLSKDMKYALPISIIILILFGSNVILLLPLPNVLKIPFVDLTYLLGKSRDIQYYWFIGIIISLFLIIKKERENQ